MLVFPPVILTVIVFGKALEVRAIMPVKSLRKYIGTNIIKETFWPFLLLWNVVYAMVLIPTY